MQDTRPIGPDRTAVRVALWRALHVESDPSPHVLEDVVGMRLAAPDEGWRNRPDMDVHTSSRARASIVGRARLLDDLVTEQADRGVTQYVILGAGLDTLVQRRQDLASRIRVFEIDQPGHQAWKCQRLEELGLGVPDWLKLVPVDFETDAIWSQKLSQSGFQATLPAFVSCTGVFMYLTREAILSTLRQVAAFAPGSKIAFSFMLPLDRIEAEERPGRENTEKFARLAGTPFLSFFTPEEAVEIAREAGFRQCLHVSSTDLQERYFTGRADGLRPSSSEEILVATV